MIVSHLLCTLFSLRLCVNIFFVLFVCCSSMNRRHGTMGLHEYDQKDLCCMTASDGVQELRLEIVGSL